MSTQRMDSLHSFLKEEGLELLNVKFVPGTGRGLRADQVERAGKEAIQRALAGGMVDNPPMSNRAKASVAE